VRVRRLLLLTTDVCRTRYESTAYKRQVSRMLFGS